jgi:hypothetical protein
MSCEQYCYIRSAGIIDVIGSLPPVMAYYQDISLFSRRPRLPADIVTSVKPSPLGKKPSARKKNFFIKKEKK